MFHLMLDDTVISYYIISSLVPMCGAPNYHSILGGELCLPVGPCCVESNVLLVFTINTSGHLAVCYRLCLILPHLESDD